MEFQLPELGEGIYEAELIQWLVQPGQQVRHGQPLAEVMTDKATMEVPAPFSGTIEALHAEPSQQVKVGQVILTYQPGDEPEQPAEATAAEKLAAAAGTGASSPAAASPPRGGNGRRAASATGAARPAQRVRAAPSVRRMARQLGVDLAQVPGSGPSGRVLIEDVTRFAAEVAEQSPAAEAGAAAGDSRRWQPGQRIRLQGIRRTIAERMVRSKQTVPHYSYIDECNVTQLVQLRRSLKELAETRGIKLTYLAFIVKAAALALRQVPVVNATWDEETGEIVLHRRCDVGVAVATPEGLMVPVVREADRKSVLQLAAEIQRLSSAARAGTASRDELIGGTFTVTSIGNIGGLISTPVINYPQVAILGAGRIVRRPVYDEQGQIVPADLLYLSFSFDHRVLDGDIGARFSNEVIKRLENAAVLLVEQPQQ